uniref:NADH-ubiquinone oxidoreductase chain 5 n=1 Tax=Scoparipes salvazai TaxID=2575669 RepID=A0A4D6X7H6_9HEMI|nr:NADH dehydrogenase subunit 5 [Scoparipes salvazai]QCI09215.1 NADH dehydrogenase subunit 5 [Scoparipes salvazai]
MNNLCYYKFWSSVLFLLGFLFFVVGLLYLQGDYSVFLDWEIMTLNSSSVVMTFLFDWMSLMFMGCVLFISSMVILYSSSYMGTDIYSIRFLILVLLFVLSMMLLIISPNLISILLGWDGLGLVSYCLVIYFQNYKSYNAGMVTVLTNRIGDVAILISIAWLFNFGSWNYIYYTGLMDNWLVWVSFLVVLAAFTKSAQVPFSSWLPAAMAAPTPVSALVHSSTLVTAGVYLLIRFSDLVMSFDVTYFLLISVLTMFMSGLGANFEYDLKSIIALSTLSQLGLMMSILFMGYPILAFFHLLSHAFFKALLFLCAGLIIHGMSDSQDIRHMGYLVSQFPYTCSCFCISSLSLCGTPFLAGFYSKDLVLEYLSYGYYNAFIYVLFFLSVGLTVMYSLRLVYYCMGGSNGMFSCQSYAEDGFMMYPMVFLTFMAITGGSLLSWLIFPHPDVLVFPLECKLMPLFVVFIGGWLGYELSVYSWLDSSYGIFYSLIFYFLGSMWFMPSFSTYMLYSLSHPLAKSYLGFMDMSWGEYVMSGSLSGFFNYTSGFSAIYQNNSIKLYLISFLFCGLFLSMMN